MHGFSFAYSLSVNPLKWVNLHVDGLTNLKVGDMEEDDGGKEGRRVRRKTGKQMRREKIKGVSLLLLMK